MFWNSSAHNVSFLKKQLFEKSETFAESTWLGITEDVSDLATK
jgi:hypothetical protein